MKEQYKVLCIAVNKVSGLDPLNFAEKDACSVSKYFETLKSNADVTLLTGKNATKKNILTWVEESNSIQKDLCLVIFFAGHGSAEKSETTNKLERCLWIDGNFNVPSDSHRLKTSEILELLNNPLHKLIFLIDACYDFDPQQRDSIQHIFKQFKESERIIGLKQYAVISASAADQMAIEDSQIGHGVLTHYFLQTMAGKYSFFLRKKIPFFKVLAILDKKVRNHRFLTDTGRKVLHKTLRKNGIMVHWNDTNFDLPVLEPVPYIKDQGKNSFQEKLSWWTHFFKRTRLRKKIFQGTGILATVLLLLTLIHLFVVRIQFEYMGPTQKLRDSGSSYSYFQQTKFYNFLLGNAGLFLSGMGPERAGQVTEKNVTLFLFKHNWVDAFLPRLDEKGKIILMGNYLGVPIHGVGEAQLLEFALDNNNKGCWFYWHPRDVNKLIAAIQKDYNHFNPDQKEAALGLLAELGEKGKNTAINIFDFKNETDRELKDLFLKHFYSPRFWEQHSGEFDIYDYLCLINYHKPVPFSNDGRAGEGTGKFLLAVAQSLPIAGTCITDTNNLSETYEKLKVSAYLGSPDFLQNASNILQSAFEPGFVLSLLPACKNFDHAVWLLEQYFRYLEHESVAEIPWEHWQTIEAFIKESPVIEKSVVRKMIIDNVFQRLPKMGRDLLVWRMHDSGPRVISLKDWERWMNTYEFYPDYVLNAVIKMKYPLVFDFIKSHYRYFEGYLFESFLEALYEMNKTETVKLLENLYPKSSPKDKLYFAAFLYIKNYPEYAGCIVEFLQEAKNHKKEKEILANRYWTIYHALTRLLETNRISKKDIRFLLDDRSLFYTFAELNLRLWPEEAKNILLASRIPLAYTEGIPLLRACEELPEPYREKMLKKICTSKIDETFELNAESSLIKYYPDLFLKMAYKKGYHLKWDRQGRLVEAYRRFSYKELERRLRFCFKIGMYGSLRFIEEALAQEESSGNLNLRDLQHILQEFNRPVERMLLRDLRRHYYKRYFSGIKNGTAI